MNQTLEISKLALALHSIQTELDPVLKNAKNPFFKSNYADLGAVWMSMRDIIVKHGVVVTQVPDMVDGALVLVTMLIHAESGQFISGKYPLTPKKMDPQEVGSAISYARRYALQAMFCQPSEDDDGNAANGNAANGRGAPCAGQQSSGKAAGPKVSEADLKLIKEMLIRGGWSQKSLLVKYKVEALKDLTPDQAKETIVGLETGLDQKVKAAEKAAAGEGAK